MHILNKAYIHYITFFEKNLTSEKISTMQTVSPEPLFIEYKAEILYMKLYMKHAAYRFRRFHMDGHNSDIFCYRLEVLHHTRLFCVGFSLRF